MQASRTRGPDPGVDLSSWRRPCSSSPVSGSLGAQHTTGATGVPRARQRKECATTATIRGARGFPTGVVDTPAALTYLLSGCVEARRPQEGCLGRQLDAAVRGHREGGVPRHLPQIAVRVREEPVASEKGLLCFLDHPGPGLCGLREYRVDVLLPSHVVRQREAREGAVLHVGYIETRVLGERGFREEGYRHPAALEERHLFAARALPGPSQAVAVGGYRATEVAHAERNDTHPWLHRSLPCGGCALGYCPAGNRRSHREICPIHRT